MQTSVHYDMTISNTSFAHYVYSRIFLLCVKEYVQEKNKEGVALIQKGMKGKGIQITDASWLLLALEIFNKCFDGIDGTKDTANDAKECCQ